MAHYDTSNTRGGEINNVGRDLVSARDIYHVSHYHLNFYNSSPAAVARELRLGTHLHTNFKSNNSCT
ncbi:hypothetical protein FIBSPDRAFT_859428 [Athelia psychrophila]|uniref:Uncharacterized protein n=1 Tax=Athelia psychrophila TaxID=1759441 RepID=A0A166L7V9_9AGAM|nr:hypothetical protein FIBSPDRAFT_859428 [Fibularhizoctonia sp. CBS 109695]